MWWTKSMKIFTPQITQNKKNKIREMRMRRKYRILKIATAGMRKGMESGGVLVHVSLWEETYLGIPKYRGKAHWCSSYYEQLPRKVKGEHPIVSHTLLAGFIMQRWVGKWAPSPWSNDPSLFLWSRYFPISKFQWWNATELRIRTVQEYESKTATTTFTYADADSG